MLTFSYSLRALLIGVALTTPTLQAQQSPAATVPQIIESQCILAGRLNSDGRWAPQATSMQLLDAGGKPVSGAAPAALDRVKAVRLSKPALLTTCNTRQAIADGDAAQGIKSPAPAVKAGNVPIQVQAWTTLPGRAGGQWVELRVSVPAERAVMLTR